MSKSKIPLLEEKLGKSLEDFLRERYSQGVGCVSIAKELGINRTVVLNYMKKYRIQTKKDEHNNKVKLQKELEVKFGDLKKYVENCRTIGVKIKDIAKEFGINAYTLSLWCNEWGFPKRRVPPELERLEKKFEGKFRNFLEQEYLVKKRTIRDIGSEIGLKADALVTYLRYFNLQTRGSAEANKIRDNVPEIKEFSYREKQVLYGSLMGDGCVSCHSKNNIIQGNAWFSEGHSLKQEKYLRWKAEELKRLGNQFYIGKQFITFKSSHLEILTGLRKLFYQEKKQITKEILNEIEELALAVWYQDDGCYNRFIKNAIIATAGFTYNEHELIQKYFREKWDLDVRIHIQSLGNSNFKRNYNEYYRLYIPVSETPRFFEIVEPYIHETMLYKIGK